MSLTMVTFPGEDRKTQNRQIALKKSVVNHENKMTLVSKYEDELRHLVNQDQVFTNFIREAFTIAKEKEPSKEKKAIIQRMFDMLSTAFISYKQMLGEYEKKSSKTQLKQRDRERLILLSVVSPLIELSSIMTLPPLLMNSIDGLLGEWVENPGFNDLYRNYKDFVEKNPKQQKNYVTQNKKSRELADLYAVYIMLDYLAKHNPDALKKIKIDDPSKVKVPSVLLLEEKESLKNYDGENIDLTAAPFTSITTRQKIATEAEIKDRIQVLIPEINRLCIALYDVLLTDMTIPKMIKNNLNLGIEKQKETLSLLEELKKSAVNADRKREIYKKIYTDFVIPLLRIQTQTAKLPITIVEYTNNLLRIFLDLNIHAYGQIMNQDDNIVFLCEYLSKFSDTAEIVEQMKTTFHISPSQKTPPHLLLDWEHKLNLQAVHEEMEKIQANLLKAEKNTIKNQLKRAKKKEKRELEKIEKEKIELEKAKQQELNSATTQDNAEATAINKEENQKTDPLTEPSLKSETKETTQSPLPATKKKTKKKKTTTITTEEKSHTKDSSLTTLPEPAIEEAPKKIVFFNPRSNLHLFSPPQEKARLYLENYNDPKYIEIKNELLTNITDYQNALEKNSHLECIGLLEKMIKNKIDLARLVLDLDDVGNILEVEHYLSTLHQYLYNIHVHLTDSWLNEMSLRHESDQKESGNSSDKKSEDILRNFYDEACENTIKKITLLGTEILSLQLQLQECQLRYQLGIGPRLS